MHDADTAYVASTLSAPLGTGLSVSTDTSLSLSGAEGVAVAGDVVGVEADTEVVLSSGTTSLSVSPSGVRVSGSLSVAAGCIVAGELHSVTVGTLGGDSAPLSLASSTNSGVSSLALDGGSVVLAGDSLEVTAAAIDASSASLSVDSVATGSLSVGDILSVSESGGVTVSDSLIVTGDLTLLADVVGTSPVDVK
ncbi:hypothetical protein KIPB_015210, partial [Kipferlia bialata]|eukprot:g15210.t1